LCANGLEVFLVNLIKGVQDIGIHVKDGKNRAVVRDDWYYNLRLSCGRTRNVIFYVVHIGHKLRFGRPGCGTTDTTGERDFQTAVPALVRAHLEVSRTGDSIETRPVKVIKGIV